MSRQYDPSSDYRNYWTLGSTVEFDGPDGERLRGEIVRVYPGSAIHVLVRGRRYEADIADDNCRMVWDDWD